MTLKSEKKCIPKSFERFYNSKDLKTVQYFKFHWILFPVPVDGKLEIITNSNTLCNFNQNDSDYFHRNFLLRLKTNKNEAEEL